MARECSHATVSWSGAVSARCSIRTLSGGPLPMSNLLVVTFENQEDGRKAHTELKNLKSEGGVNIQDVELVERDAEGNIHRVGKVDETTKVGILGGGLLGLLMGLVFFPVLGLTIGAVAG